MSAAELRMAAETLREQAEDANPSPWTSDRNAVRTGRDALALTYDIRYGNDTDQTNKDARYIATMHPGVGLALAEWLDAVAIGWVWDEHPDDVETPDGWPLTLEESVDTIPLKIARLINGGAR